MLIRKIPGIFLLFMLVVCCAPALQAQDSAVPQEILTQANAFAQSGDTSRALSLLRQFVLEYPDAAQTLAAYTQLSRILLQEERLEQARLYAARIPASRRPEDLTLLLAQGYMAKEDFVRAQEMLTQLRGENLSPMQQLGYLQLQADIALQRAELMQTLVYCDQILQSPRADEDKLTLASRTAYDALLQMDPLAREESAFMFEDTPVGSLLQLYHLEAQDPANVEPGSKMQGKGVELARSAKNAWVRQRALAWLDQVEGRSWHQHALGVVLPLSGRYAPFGRMVKQGIELALAQQMGTNIELIVRDSRAEVGRTETVMRDLLETQRVLAVLGPMMGEPATRAAEMAQEYRVPIVLLSHWEGLPQLGSYVFRHSLTAKQQAQALANYAMQILGMETFALLQPENKLGDNFTRYFSSALKQKGAEVLYHRSYSPGSTDFRAALKPMVPPEEEKEQGGQQGQTKTQGVEDGQDMKSAEEKTEPELEFDALFIPDFADTIGLLAPQLAFSDIEGAQLLGINGWNSTDLLNQAGRYVRGAVFTDGFDPDSSDIFVQKFVTQYLQHYGEMPTILAAQGYDVANLLIQLLQDPRVTSPRHVRTRIKEIDYTGGVSGLRGFDHDGEAVRDIVLFKFGRSQIERIDPAAMQPVKLDNFTVPAFD